MNQTFEDLGEFRQMRNRPHTEDWAITLVLARGRMVTFFQFLGKVAVAMETLMRLVMWGREYGRVSLIIGRERPSCPEALEDDFWRESATSCREKGRWQKKLLEEGGRGWLAIASKSYSVIGGWRLTVEA